MHHAMIFDTICVEVGSYTPNRPGNARRPRLTAKRDERGLCVRKKIFLVALALCLFCCSVVSAEERYGKNYFGAFDTVVQLIGYTDNEAAFDRAAEGMMDQLREYHKAFDGYNSYPDLHNVWYLNHYAGQGPVEVPDCLFDLLSWCKDVSAQIPSKVNIAMGSVLSLWHEERERGLEDPSSAKLPDRAALEEAALHTDFDDVILNPENRTVFFADPKLKLDLGAVAKGWAADQVQQTLMETMPSFLVSLGGNVYAGDAPADGRKHWGVSIQDPDGSVLAALQSDYLDVLYVDHVSVVTSGDYQRFYTVDGENYCHIIDPDTLMPAKHMRAVTVLCESSGLADYLSTALFLLPIEEATAFVESLPGVEALFCAMDGTVTMTEGMAKVTRSHGATSGD